jgi:putative ABC transport system permease protein
MLSDLRYALRGLRRAPGFALAAVLTLALGIGANSAIFSVVNSVLLRPLPYAAPEQLVMVWGRYPEFGRTSTSIPDFRDWREQTGSFAAMAARREGLAVLMGSGEPEQLTADRVTANFFQTLGVRPRLGRGFLPEEELGGGGEDQVVVLSDGFWRRRFGADAGVVGRTITLSGRPYTVVGIAPADFRFARAVDLWAPLQVDDPEAQRRSESLTVFGRLKPGVTVARAGADLAGVLRRLAEQYPETNGSLQSEVIGMQDDFVGDVRPAIVAFMGAVGLVLLIACANVANLLLARAAAREREVAVRVALGAGQGRLVRQLLTESAVLAVLGGLLGLALAAWAVAAVRAAEVQFIPRQTEVRVDVAVVLFSLVLAAATGLLFGLAPAVRLAGTSLQGVLREGARGSTLGGAAGRLRSALVLGEVAVALVLLVGAGLLIRSFEMLNRVDVGFDPRGVLTYQAVFPTAKFQDVEQLPALYERVIDGARAIPGVQGAAVSRSLPMDGAGYITFAIEGRPSRESSAGAAPEDLQPFAVSPGYFGVLRIPLRRGRLFAASDAAGAPDVALINEEMARRFFTDGRDPIGRRVTFGDPADTSAVWSTIVGVVGDVAQEGVTAKPYPQLYRPIAQQPSRLVAVALRTARDPLAIAPAARQALRAVDRDVPLSRLQTLEARVADSIARPRVSVLLISAFAWVALTLAAVGIYGVMSYTVAQRTREIGVRMALGASAGNVQRLVVRQGMGPALVGVAVGLVLALLGSRLIASLLYGVSAVDPLTFVAVPIFLGAVALLATVVPAFRATRVAPTVALRSE